MGWEGVRTDMEEERGGAGALQAVAQPGGGAVQQQQRVRRGRHRLRRQHLDTPRHHSAGHAPQSTIPAFH